MWPTSSRHQPQLHQHLKARQEALVSRTRPSTSGTAFASLFSTLTPFSPKRRNSFLKKSKKMMFYNSNRLITQLEKADLLFDVSEVLNPFQFILRVKTYDNKSLKVLSVNDITESELLQELKRDQLSYLVTEPHRRQELAKYIVQNSFYDDSRRQVQFLQSS